MSSQENEVKISQLPHGQDLPLPTYATEYASGVDLFAAVKSELQLSPWTSALIPTGIAVALPKGLEGQIRPRSGLALHHCVSVLNTPGTIDADYRGEIQVLLINLANTTFTVTYGMKIAQLVFAPVVHVAWEAVTTLPSSPRGTGGFGHTGTR